MAIWDITNAVNAVMGRDNLVLVDGTVKVAGTVHLGDLVACALGVVEVDSRVLSSNSESERMRAFEEAANKTIFRRRVAAERE